MGKQIVKKGFGVYFDPRKSTSGQRFFDELCRELGKEAIPLSQRPAAILFNVSGSIKAIIKAKLRRQKVLLRIDGLYFDKLSPTFLARFRWPLRQVFSMALKYSWAQDSFASLANMIDENYRAFARILLCDRIIYQSRFSQKVHMRYFRNKSCDVIVNGSIYRGQSKSSRAIKDDNEIRLVTIYDEWKPAKRIDDLVAFVQWARESKKVPLNLTILGYTGKAPSCAPPSMKSIIETAPFVHTLPRFQSFDGEIQKALFDSHIYITFSFRDPCPNAVIEAMAHGLPVVGLTSGGLPDIVGDAGMLIPMDDFDDGFFSSHRFDCDFPPIDFEQILQAVLTVSTNRERFQERVRDRFATGLEIEVVAERYASVLRALANDSGN